MGKNKSYAGGRLAEWIALIYLLFKGYFPVAKNVVTGKGTHAGEVDLIVRRGSLLVFVEVKKRQNLEKAAYAKLALAIFPCLVVHHKLAYLGVSGVLGQVGDISVHIAIYLYALYNLVAVSLEPAVEVVQVLYARNLACRGVEQLGGQCFAQWVVSFLLVSADKVVAFLFYHSV